MDTRALRQALGRFSTGVTIITCCSPEGERIGLTANSFSSLSLSPPLVLWSLRSVSPSLAAFLAAPGFAINVLAESQVELSRRFASAVTDKFAEGAWSDGLHGAPVLAGCPAVLECSRFDAREMGDHWLLVGQVERAVDAPIAPLLFQSGHYRLLGEIL
jgi:4-hydroxyphenylacetate 3-hydroxylase, reductase component